ncbi:acyl-CoA dehydrogenase [Streptomyces sp. NPDC032198]|uniref:acyl-CoA dehydrogenase n=1 Tax=Streptomyces sp. NPDC032198 TaxID=3155127 RepID=UPI0033D9BEE1
MTISAETVQSPAAAHGRAEADASARAARFEALLGDPYDLGNPHGLHALFAADARRTPPAGTEALLAREGLGAEFVPAAYGGRLTRADLLVRVLRPVFRRDIALGFGSGVTSLFAAGAVWAAGSGRQRRDTADLLLGGGRATALHHAPAPADASPHQDRTVTAHAKAGGYRVDGRRDMVVDAERADLQVVYARTAAAPGARSHSVLLLDPAGRHPGHLRHLPRVETLGMRGVPFSGLEFTDCAVPADALVGGAGDGTELALRVFQVNGSVLCGLVTPAVDTVLHSAVRAVTAGRGGPVAKRWRKPLAGVFADLLACDAMATVALRALSLLPAGAHLLAAAVMYVVPGQLREDLEELATVLGSHGYEHASAEYGALGKLMRDLTVAGLGPTGTVLCRSLLAPQLGGLARGSWFAEPEPPPELFHSAAELPFLDYGLIAVAGGGDFMCAALVGSAARLAALRGAGGHIAELAVLAERFVGELRALREECRRLPTSGAALTDPAVIVLIDRYSRVVGAAAVLGVWESQDGSDPFLADPAWALLALSRIGGNLALPVPDLPHDCQDRVFGELVRRYREGRGFGLDTPAPARAAPTGRARTATAQVRKGP